MVQNWPKSFYTSTVLAYWPTNSTLPEVYTTKVPPVRDFKHRKGIMQS